MYDFIDNFRTTHVWPYQNSQSRIRWDWGKSGRNYANRNNLSLACFVSPLSSGSAYGQVYDRFSLVKYNNTGATYAHELAHNFTVFHQTGGYVRNDEDADLNDTQFYASNLDNNKRTSMGSYNLQLRIARFSNPNKNYSGYPYGTADRNNAAVMRGTRTNVRSYRGTW